MDIDDVPVTGTCDLTTIGRRSGQSRTVEIWYVVIDGRFAVTGTPGARDWLANLRADPHATVTLRDPVRELAVVAEEIVDEAQRRRFVADAFRLQTWYAEQPFTVDDWVDDAPMVWCRIDRQTTGGTT